MSPRGTTVKGAPFKQEPPSPTQGHPIPIKPTTLLQTLFPLQISGIPKFPGACPYLIWEVTLSSMLSSPTSLLPWLLLFSTNHPIYHPPKYYKVCATNHCTMALLALPASQSLSLSPLQPGPFLKTLLQAGKDRRLWVPKCHTFIWKSFFPPPRLPLSSVIIRLCLSFSTQDKYQCSQIQPYSFSNLPYLLEACC